jgi:hypothetical protein
MSETRAIYIESDEVDLMQSYLDSEGEDEAGTLATYTAIFEDNVEADIKVCKGNPPFVDAVLYEDGSEVELIEVTDELLGEYMFFYNGKVYTVVVEEGRE